MTTTQDLQCASDVREMLAEYKMTGRLVDLERVLDAALSLLEDKENGETEKANDGLIDEIQSIKQRVDLFFEVDQDDKKAVELLSIIQDELKYY